MNYYKCENTECGKIFRSNNPDFCPKCNSIEFSSHHKKPKKKFIIIGGLILLIGASLFYIQTDRNKNSNSKEITSKNDCEYSVIYSMTFKDASAEWQIQYRTCNGLDQNQFDKSKEKYLKDHTIFFFKDEEYPFQKAKEKFLEKDVITGKFSCKYLPKDKKSKSQLVSFNGGLMYATTKLNVRKNPNIDSKKLHSLRKNTPVLTSKDKSNGWVLIADTENNQLGYVKSKYLSKSISTISVSTNKKLKQVKKENTLTASDYFDKAFNRKGTKNSDCQYRIDNYTKCLKINPDYDPAAYYNRGNAYSQLEKYYAAIADYNNTIRLDPDYYSAYINRGMAYQDLGAYSDAIDDYTKAIKLEPKTGLAYRNRGVAKKKSGGYTSSNYKNDYRKACKYGETDCCDWY